MFDCIVMQVCILVYTHRICLLLSYGDVISKACKHQKKKAWTRSHRWYSTSYLDTDKVSTDDFVMIRRDNIRCYILYNIVLYKSLLYSIILPHTTYNHATNNILFLSTYMKHNIILNEYRLNRHNNLKHKKL